MAHEDAEAPRDGVDCHVEVERTELREPGDHDDEFLEEPRCLPLRRVPFDVAGDVRPRRPCPRGVPRPGHFGELLVGIRASRLLRLSRSLNKILGKRWFLRTKNAARKKKGMRGKLPKRCLKYTQFWINDSERTRNLFRAATRAEDFIPLELRTTIETEYRRALYYTGRLRRWRGRGWRSNCCMAPC
jgi:hypothetical protein